jgi:hypothetical protein
MPPPLTPARPHPTLVCLLLASMLRVHSPQGPDSAAVLAKASHGISVSGVVVLSTAIGEEIREEEKQRRKDINGIRGVHAHS